MITTLILALLREYPCAYFPVFQILKNIDIYRYGKFFDIDIARLDLRLSSVLTLPFLKCLCHHWIVLLSSVTFPQTFFNKARTGIVLLHKFRSWCMHAVWTEKFFASFSSNSDIAKYQRNNYKNYHALFVTVQATRRWPTKSDSHTYFSRHVHSPWMWNLATAPARSDLIYVTSRRNDGFLHSFCNFSKSNAFGENFIRTKFILHNIFFWMSILSSRKTLRMFFNLHWKNCEKPFVGGHGHFDGKGVSSDKN